MKEFHSVFYKKNKLIRYTLTIYCGMTVLMLILLLYVGYDVRAFLLMTFTFVMALRASYLIFEKLVVDADKGVVTLKIRRKRFDVSQLQSIKKVRQGQVRLIDRKGIPFPVSVEDEDGFISLLQSINDQIQIE